MIERGIYVILQQSNAQYVHNRNGIINDPIKKNCPKSMRTIKIMRQIKERLCLVLVIYNIELHDFFCYKN
jgi:hypothetical protein